MTMLSNPASMSLTAIASSKRRAFLIIRVKVPDFCQYDHFDDVRVEKRLNDAPQTDFLGR
jgi:hypothetical protein